MAARAPRCSSVAIEHRTMQLRLLVFDLPLRHTFRTSRSAVDVQPTLIAELTEGEHRGYGEAISHRYYGVSLEGMAAALDSVRPILAERELDDPAELWDELHPQLEAHPFAHCALDEAAYDLWGKLRGQPVEALGPRAAKPPAHELHDRHRHDRGDGREDGGSFPAGRSTRSSSAPRTTSTSCARCAGTPTPCSASTRTARGPSTRPSRTLAR